MIRRIEEIEHECDTIAHMTIDLLHRTFITPLDRDETLKLISKMDDVVDGIESAAQRMLLFDVQQVPARLVDLARVVMKEQEVLVELVPLLHGFKHPERIRELIIEVQRLENEADGILRAGLGELFREHRSDPLMVIQVKELYERIEDAADQAEDVAEII
jgi:predicted phosphate transport protein (TIGR00153 family)